jgi:hypothetical protein
MLYSLDLNTNLGNCGDYYWFNTMLFVRVPKNQLVISSSLFINQDKNFKQMINRMHRKTNFLILIEIWLFCGDSHDVNANEFPYQRLFQGDIETLLVDVRKQGFVFCYQVIDISVQVTSKTQVPDCVSQQILKKMKPSSRYVVNMFPIVEFTTLLM